MNLEQAIQIAVSAHKGQVNEAGMPYILHPLRVMLQMDTDLERIVALLHHVLEEPDWSPSRLKENGASQEILTILDHTTQRRSESFSQFLSRAAKNPIARKVVCMEFHGVSANFSGLQERSMHVH